MTSESRDFFDRLAADRPKAALYIVGCWLAGAAVEALVLILLPRHSVVLAVGVVLAMAVPLGLLYPLIRRYHGGGAWQPSNRLVAAFHRRIVTLLPPESLPRVLLAAALFALLAVLLQAALQRFT